MKYTPYKMPRFEKNLNLYAGLRKRIQKAMQKILEDPYQGTESLSDAPGGLNLKGCRSAHVGMNFRILFVVCEECRREPECRYCACEGLADATVVFLTVGPHAKAYGMK